MVEVGRVVVVQGQAPRQTDKRVEGHRHSRLSAEELRLTVVVVQQAVRRADPVRTQPLRLTFADSVLVAAVAAVVALA